MYFGRGGKRRPGEERETIPLKGKLKAQLCDRSISFNGWHCYGQMSRLVKKTSGVINEACRKCENGSADGA